MAYPLLQFIKFQLLDLKILKKRDKWDIQTYILTDYPSHNISYQLIKNAYHPITSKINVVNKTVARSDTAIACTPWGLSDCKFTVDL